jgi:translocator protein
MVCIMLKLFISILICQCAGIVGALFTRNAISEWYVYLRKPLFNPPDWIFGPVWTLLYILMGIAAYLVWRKGFYDQRVRAAIGIFLIQLGLNIVWSIVFFGYRSIIGGMLVIGCLWLTILWTMQAFFSLSKQACYLLIPYIIWVSFALVLNLAFLVLN